MRATLLTSLCIFPALAGCDSLRPGPWYAAPVADHATLLSQHGVSADGLDVLRRDVSVYVFVFPAGTGFPEWGIRRADGVVEIIAPATSVERQRKENQSGELQSGELDSGKQENSAHE